MLALTLAATLLAGLPTKAPEGHNWLSRAGYPWFGLTFGFGGQAPPVLGFRAELGVRTAWDIVEFGGTALTGFSFEGFGGGFGYVKLTPYPVGIGRIFYLRGNVGRIHFVNPGGRDHRGTLAALLGFRIPTDPPVAMAGAFLFIEIGADHRRHCEDWAMPCTAEYTQWWPSGAFGVHFH